MMHLRIWLARSESCRFFFSHMWLGYQLMRLPRNHMAGLSALRLLRLRLLRLLGLVELVDFALDPGAQVFDPLIAD